MNQIDLEGMSIRSIHSVNLLPSSKNKTFLCEDRKTCAVVYKINGRSAYKANGERFIMDPHHIMLLLRRSSYLIEYLEPGDFIIVEFECDPDYKENGICSYYVKNNTILFNIFSALEREWTFKKFAYIKKCFSLLYEILAYIEQSTKMQYISDSKLNIIRPSLEFLENNYSDPGLSILQLAKQSDIGVSYFRKLFTNIYMVSPAKYLQKIRISKARDLLISQSHSIGEIAEMTGYSNIYYFSNVFKKETGLSPTEFLRGYLRGEHPV